MSSAGDSNASAACFEDPEKATVFSAHSKRLLKHEIHNMQIWEDMLNEPVDSEDRGSRHYA